MENSHLKNSLIAAGIAVFAGVITLGANVAFGVTAPTQNPTDAALYSPVFNGLDVRGEIKNTGSTNNGQLNILDDLLVGSLAQTNNLAVSGKIVSGGDIVSSKKLSSNGDTNVGGKLSVGYTIHSVLDNYVGGNLTVGVQMVNGILDSVNGPTSQGGGALEVRGPITNSAGSLNLDDDVKIHGQISNTSTTVSGGSTVENPVIINDKEGLRVSWGKLDTWGPILNTIGNPVEITGDLDVNYSDIKGILTKVPLGSGKIRSNSLETQSIVNSVFTVSGGVESNLPLNIEDDLKVTGKITSKGGFGTYTFRPAVTAKAITNTNFSWSLQGCNAGEVIVSCYANSYSSDPGASFTAGESGDMSVSGLYIFDNQCEANYKNNSGSTRYVKAAALCLDPTK